MNKHYFDGIEWEADVLYSGAPMSVVMSFANEEEMRKISAWADYVDFMPGRMSRDQKDILEYASLLGGMFRTYESDDRFAGSAQRLERIIQDNPREDVLFALVMKLPVSAAVPAPFACDEILGFSAMRRTWMNTIKVEFLAVNPLLAGENTEFRGVGNALLAASVQLSEMLSVPMFWGESSDTSLGFYLNRKFRTLEEIVYLDSAGIARFVEETNMRIAS